MMKLKDELQRLLSSLGPKIKGTFKVPRRRAAWRLASTVVQAFNNAADPNGPLKVPPGPKSHTVQHAQVMAAVQRPVNALPKYAKSPIIKMMTKKQKGKKPNLKKTNFAP